MKMPGISLLEWQNRFGNEKACMRALAKVRWPQGFQCPQCGFKKYSYITTRKFYQCSQCRHQLSVTTDTLFHSTKGPFFQMVLGYFVNASDKGGVSALKLSKQICLAG
jgi:ribosomal protein L37AE/L43A